MAYLMGSSPDYYVTGLAQPGGGCPPYHYQWVVNGQLETLNDGTGPLIQFTLPLGQTAEMTVVVTDSSDPPCRITASGSILLDADGGSSSSLIGGGGSSSSSQSGGPSGTSGSLTSGSPSSSASGTPSGSSGSGSPSDSWWSSSSSSSGGSSWSSGSQFSRSSSSSSCIPGGPCTDPADASSSSKKPSVWCGSSLTAQRDIEGDPTASDPVGWTLEGPLGGQTPALGVWTQNAQGWDVTGDGTGNLTVIVPECAAPGAYTATRLFTDQDGAKKQEQLTFYVCCCPCSSSSAGPDNPNTGSLCPVGVSM